jgi:hypothetical protein
MPACCPLMRTMCPSHHSLVTCHLPCLQTKAYSTATSPAMLDEVLEPVPSLAELHDQVEVLLVLVHLPQANNTCYK